MSNELNPIESFAGGLDKVLNDAISGLDIVISNFVEATQIDGPKLADEFKQRLEEGMAKNAQDLGSRW